jgi:hypothetical protein
VLTAAASQQQPAAANSNCSKPGGVLKRTAAIQKMLEFARKPAHCYPIQGSTKKCTKKKKKTKGPFILHFSRQGMKARHCNATGVDNETARAN